MTGAAGQVRLGRAARRWSGSSWRELPLGRDPRVHAVAVPHPGDLFTVRYLEGHAPDGGSASRQLDLPVVEIAAAGNGVVVGLALFPFVSTIVVSLLALFSKLVAASFCTRSRTPTKCWPEAGWLYWLHQAAAHRGRPQVHPLVWSADQPSPLRRRPGRSSRRTAACSEVPAISLASWATCRRRSRRSASQIAGFVVRACADQARLLDTNPLPRPVLGIEAFTANLVDVLLGILQAPDHGQRRRAAPGD